MTARCGEVSALLIEELQYRAAAHLLDVTAPDARPLRLTEAGMDVLWRLWARLSVIQTQEELWN